MELATHRFYQAGPPNLGDGPYQFAYQEAFEKRIYGVQEGHQHLGSIRDLQQTTEPRIKPDPQNPPSLPLFHNLSHYEQNPNPNDMHRGLQPDRRTLYNGMHVQNIGESANGHGHNHQQRYSQETDQKAPLGTSGRVQGQTYAAHNNPSDGLFNGHRTNETPFLKLEHGIPPPLPPATSVRPYGSVGGSYDGRPKKAQRVDNACISCRALKTKCTGDRPMCKNCNEKDLECVYEKVTPHKIEKAEQLLTKIDVRTQEMEKILQQLIANSKRESMDEPHNTTTMPQHESAVWRSHRTAASSILSYDFVRKVVGNVVDDDENAETIWREANLYMKHVNTLYPLLTLTQLESLIQDFVMTNSISNTISEQSAGLKRKRSGSELPQSSIERALVLLIRALGKKYDNATSPEGEGSPGGSTMFRNGYPTPKHVEKSWLTTALDEHSSYETRTAGVTPGSDYFAAATDIMATHIGGSSLCHVQVYLLASIYHGQLAQDAQRHKFLLEAARALQSFLQSKLKQFESAGWDSTVISIFWAQRLLEGELVAERALPESDLHVWEQTVPLPDIQQTDAFMIQLQLRKHLGAIDTDLYQQGCLENHDTQVLDDQVALSKLYATVERLYRRVGEIYKPHPVEADDPNPSLTMRLNAKVIATMALTFRPCLMILLNRKDPDAKFSYLVSDYAKRCIGVLEYSIRSSNLIKDDSLITHAQWGNVMLLLAASSDVAVKHFIKHDLLRDLVSQTQESLSTWLSSALEQKYVKVLKDMALRTGLYQ